MQRERGEEQGMVLGENVIFEFVYGLECLSRLFQGGLSSCCRVATMAFFVAEFPEVVTGVDHEA